MSTHGYILMHIHFRFKIRAFSHKKFSKNFLFSLTLFTKERKFYLNWKINFLALWERESENVMNLVEYIASVSVKRILRLLWGVCGIHRSPSLKFLASKWRTLRIKSELFSHSRGKKSKKLLLGKSLKGVKGKRKISHTIKPSQIKQSLVKKVSWKNICWKRKKKERKNFLWVKKEKKKSTSNPKECLV